MIVLLIYFTLTIHAQPPPPSSKWLEQCEAGVGQACFSYSLYLESQRDPQGKELAKVYMRRACTMAYAPACTYRLKTNETALKEGSSGSTGDAGVDGLLAHRGQVKTTADQIQAQYGSDGRSAAIDADLKTKMSVVERMGFRATPLMLKLFGKSAFMFTSNVRSIEKPESENSQ